MFSNQSIPNPYGLTVFGSSIIRVEPDVVVITFAVQRIDPQTGKAFAAARDAAAEIQKYLHKFDNADVRTSQVTLRQHTVYRNGEHEIIGYQANVGFNVILRDLFRLTEMLNGVIELGANNIGSIDFQTTRLKGLRSQARIQAVEAAVEKAQVYCSAAHRILGDVVHIEDVNPDTLRGNEGHVQSEVPMDTDGEILPFSADSIVVKGAVRIAFAFAD